MKQSLRFLVFLTTFTLSVGSAMAQREPSKGRVPEHTSSQSLHSARRIQRASLLVPLHLQRFRPAHSSGYGSGRSRPRAKSLLSDVHRPPNGRLGSFPPRDFRFLYLLISAGLYFGGSKLLDITGRFDPAELAAAGIPADQIGNIRLDVGGTTIAPNRDGSAEAQLKVNAIRPYVGLGVGRAIPRGRVGFRAEAGAIFHGKPSIASPNIVKQTPTSELDGLNKFLSKWKVYPRPIVENDRKNRQGLKPLT